MGYFYECGEMVTDPKTNKPILNEKGNVIFCDYAEPARGLVRKIKDCPKCGGTMTIAH